MSVKIIGGADGPTAIYLGSSINWPFIIKMIIVIAAGILTFLFFRKRKK